MERIHPNLILITTDQQRWDALACAGNPIVRTPNIDRLAAEGTLFSQAVTPCPICIPARVSILTGRMSGAYGVIENYQTRTQPETILPRALAEAGYHTRAIGCMNFVPSTETYGFQDMILCEETGWVRSPSIHTDGRIRFDDYDRYLHERGLWGWDKPIQIGYNEIKPTINPLPIEHHVTTWCGDRAVEYLEEIDRDFFLFLSFTKPHPPYDAPQGTEDWYDPDSIPSPLKKEGEYDTKHPDLENYRKQHEFHLYSDEAARTSLSYYYSNITLIDQQIGRVLDTLESRGLLENTMILFTSDHGDLMGDHGLWFKSLGYEGSVRVPMILRGVDQSTQGRRSDQHVGLIDILPTFLTAAGCELPQNLPGRDLAGVARDPASDRPFMAIEVECMNGPLQILRSRKWKYIHYESGDFEELYDLEKDPCEFTNLALDPDFRETARSLRSDLAAYLSEHSTPALSLANGDLRSRPYTPISSKPGPMPFSQMPWMLRAPPATLDDPEQIGWWWARKDGSDWSCMLDDDDLRE
jgi:arylsulfatase A-like enzyme